MFKTTPLTEPVKLTAPVLLKALLTPIIRCPSLIVVPPVYVLCPVSVKDPCPCLTTAPDPLIIPAYVVAVCAQPEFYIGDVVNVPDPNTTFPPLLPPPFKAPTLSSISARLKIAPLTSANSTIP